MATSPALTARLRDRRFYLFIAVLTAAIVFAGFARTFFLNGFFAKLHLPSLYTISSLASESILPTFGAAWPLWPLSLSLFLPEAPELGSPLRTGSPAFEGSDHAFF